MAHKDVFWMACDSTEQLRAEYGPFHTREEAEAEARKLRFGYLLRYEHILSPEGEIQEVRCVFLELQDLEWQNTGLQGMEWQNAELQNLELQNMEARNTDLHNSDLRNSDLQNADLQNTDPRDPELQNPEVRNEDSQETPSWDAPPVSPHNVPKPGVTFHTRCASCGEAAAHDQPWRAEVWADIHEFEHIRHKVRLFEHLRGEGLKEVADWRGHAA
jgi:hypothetical protein